MKDYEKIIISKNKEKPVKIKKNPTSYKLIGKGIQGAVFRISPKKCVKIYHNSKHRKWEEEVLRDLNKSPYFPNIYTSGPNYIVMEYVNGTPLNKFLNKKKSLPKKITKQIIKMTKDMKRYKLTRIDAAIRHILVTKDQNIKVVDHVTSRKVKTSKPKRLIKGLNKVGHLHHFSNQVKSIDKKIYNEWKKEMKKYF